MTTCKECGAEFEPGITKGRWVFCSEKCSRRHHSSIQRQKYKAVYALGTRPRFVEHHDDHGVVQASPNPASPYTRAGTRK